MRATPGTTFNLYLSAVDAKVRVFVSVGNILPKANGVLAELMKGPSGYADASAHVVLDGIEYCEIGIDSGGAFPEWELISRNDNRQIALQFKVALLLDKTIAYGPLLNKAECWVNGSLGRTREVTSTTSRIASSRFPLPRFALKIGIDPPIVFDYWKP